MTARVASSTNIAWWHRFSAPIGSRHAHHARRHRHQPCAPHGGRASGQAARPDHPTATTRTGQRRASPPPQPSRPAPRPASRHALHATEHRGRGGQGSLPWRALLAELGKERGPPFPEGGELSTQLFQLAVDPRQLGPRLLFPQVALAMQGLARSSTSRRSSRSHGFPCIAAGRYCSLPASIAAKISSASGRTPGEPSCRSASRPCVPNSRSWRSMSGDYLPADEFAEAGADHGDAGTGSRS